MEKLSSLLNNIKERLSSPLIFSFIVSWIFINWKISVALLWYDPPKLSMGHLSLIDYISSQTNTYKSFYLPIAFALLYTFCSPLVKNLINAFYTLTSKWGENWNLRISKGGKVPFEKYLSLREKLDVKRKQLLEFIEEESETSKILQQTESALLGERQKCQQLQNQYSESKSIIDNLYRSNILDGNWNKSIKRDNSSNENTQVIQINNSTVFITGSSIQQQYQINHFIFDSTQRRIQFILFNINQDKAENKTDYILSDLEYHSQEHLSGWEYSIRGRFKVEYRKPQLPLD